MTNGVFISTATLGKLPADIRSAVLNAVGIDISTPALSEDPDYEQLDGVARFNERQVRQLLKKPIHKTTKQLLQVIAELGPRFRVGDALKKLGVKHTSELKGALSGLTRRTRSIANDKEIDFFRAVQEADNESNSISEIHPETHAALRRVLMADWDN